MNRQNFLGHLALAVMVIMLAAFAGQMRRWQSEPRPSAPENTGPEVIATDEAAVDMMEETELLVRFRSGTTAEEVERIAARFGDRVEDRVESVSGLAVITDTDGFDRQEFDAYRALPGVEFVEPNYRISLDPEDAEDEVGGSFSVTEMDRESSAMPDDPMFGEQWALENKGQRDGKIRADVGALNAWAKATGSNKVVVAVLDSGVDYTHPDLTNNMWVRPANIAPYRDEQLGAIEDARGYNAVDNSGDPMDENGHGTHCAGIIGAEGNNAEGIAGVNWKVEIMPLKFMSAGGFGTTKDAIEAINYVIERKRAGVNVRVISASWGSTQKSRALGEVIRKAGEEGILFVAASGNSSANTDRSPHYPSSYDLPNVISVAALNRRDELASFSNYGPKSVHVAAPGAEILSTWLGGEYEEHSGTSMATPVVSGIAALVLSVDNDLSVKELRERLLGSVDKLDPLNGKVASGGRICAARALGVSD